MRSLRSSSPLPSSSFPTRTAASLHDAGLRRHRGLVAARSRRGARHRVGAVGHRPRWPSPRVGLFAVFALWILISIRWAPDAERAFAQFDQVALYVAVLAFAIVLARLVPASALVGGVALALSGGRRLALVSRCFPSTFGLILLATQAQLLHPLYAPAQLPARLLERARDRSRARLSAAALDHGLAPPPARGALAALPLPILAAVMYLTSSRGAFVAAAVGVVAYLLLTAETLAGAGRAVVVAARRRRRRRRSCSRERPRQRRRGHRARRPPGPPRALWIGDRLRPDGARVGRTGRAREAAADAPASAPGRRPPSRSWPPRRRGRRGASDRAVRRLQEQRCRSPTRTAPTTNTPPAHRAPAVDAGSSGAPRSPSSGPIR